MSGHNGTHAPRSKRRGPPPALRVASETSAASQRPAQQGPSRSTDGAAAAAQVTPAVAELAQATTEARQSERRALVERAAYFRAEARGFAPGHEVEDWLAAEAEVEQQLRDGAFAPA